jgi:hypothetical protein
MCYTKIPHQWDPIYLGYKIYTVVGYHESDKTIDYLIHGNLQQYIDLFYNLRIWDSIGAVF